MHIVTISNLVFEEAKNGHEPLFMLFLEVDFCDKVTDNPSGAFLLLCISSLEDTDLACMSNPY